MKLSSFQSAQSSYVPGVKEKGYETKEKKKDKTQAVIVLLTMCRVLVAVSKLVGTFILFVSRVCFISVAKYAVMGGILSWCEEVAKRGRRKVCWSVRDKTRGIKRTILVTPL